MTTYVVKQIFVADPKAAGQIKERLIEAPTKAAAIRKVADETISAEVPTVETILRLAKAGVALEKVAE